MHQHVELACDGGCVGVELLGVNQLLHHQIGDQRALGIRECRVDDGLAGATLHFVDVLRLDAIARILLLIAGDRTLGFAAHQHIRHVDRRARDELLDECVDGGALGSLACASLELGAHGVAVPRRITVELLQRRQLIPLGQDALLHLEHLHREGDRSPGDRGVVVVGRHLCVDQRGLAGSEADDAIA